MSASQLPKCFPEAASCESDLERLRTMAFRHVDRCGGVIRGFHAMRRKVLSHPAQPGIARVYEWLLSPLTLWALDYAGIGEHIVRTLRADGRFSADFLLLLRLIAAPPGDFTRDQIAQYEETVTKGYYDYLVKQPEKFREREAEILADGELSNCWNEAKKQFRFDPLRSARGVIRRTLSQERNFNPFVPFIWRGRRKAEIVFDAICYRWGLYGFENDKPLLLKISVNPTPHGTMLVIPRHWSFDQSRDLDWHAISKVHRAHGISRQGPKLSSARIERHVEREKAKGFRDEARRNGLRGDAVYDFVAQKMGWDPRSDQSKLKRLLRQTPPVAPVDPNGS